MQFYQHQMTQKRQIGFAILLTHLPCQKGQIGYAILSVVRTNTASRPSYKKLGSNSRATESKRFGFTNRTKCGK